MKVIKERSEETLVQKVSNGLDVNGNRYCLHIRGVAFRQKDFDVLPELLAGWVGHTSGEIYVCFDRDLFVFSENLSPEVFERLKEHFYARFEYEPYLRSKPLSFYDIENNALGLTDLAETKLAKKINFQKQEAQKEREETKELERQSFLAGPINSELLSTLKRRREARSHIEIMVVEDDAFSRNLVATALNACSVSFAEDGHEAIMGYLHKAPDIVFLDIELPDVTGHDVLSKVLSFDRDAFIVMLSGNSQSENVQSAIQQGAKGFVGKPFTKEKLLQYINKCGAKQLTKEGL